MLINYFKQNEAKKATSVPEIISFLANGGKMSVRCFKDGEQITVTDNAEILKLINSGSNIDVNLFEQGHPINVSDVIELIENGADVNETNSNGDTALHHLCLQEDSHAIFDIALEMIKQGAKLDRPNNFNTTPLMIATGKGHLKTVNLLIQKGADVNKLDSDGNTVLSYAIHNGKNDVAIALIDSGADVTIKDRDGRTALDMAQDKNLLTVVQHIQNKVENIIDVEWEEIR